MKPRLLFVLLFIFLFSSCIEDINLDTGEGRLVTVNCILTQDAVQRLKLTYSHTVVGQDYIPITEGDVLLYETRQGSTYQVNKLVGKFSFKQDGIWELEYAAVPLAEYKIEIVLPGQDSLVTAQTVMPAKMEVLSKKYPYDHVSHQGYENKTGFYLEVDDQAWIWVYGMNCNEITGKEEIAALITTDRTEIDPLTASDYRLDDFGSNIQGLDLEYSPNKNALLYNYYLRFKKAHEVVELGYNVLFENGQAAHGKTDLFSIGGTFRKDYYLNFMSVSAEYDQYLKTSYQKIKKIAGNEDFTQIYDDTMVYSNIKNGIGIFGAAYTVSVPDF